MYEYTDAYVAWSARQGRKIARKSPESLHALRLFYVKTMLVSIVCLLCLVPAVLWFHGSCGVLEYGCIPTIAPWQEALVVYSIFLSAPAVIFLGACVMNFVDVVKVFIVWRRDA